MLFLCSALVFSSLDAVRRLFYKNFTIKMAKLL